MMCNGPRTPGSADHRAALLRNWNHRSFWCLRALAWGVFLALGSTVWGELATLPVPRLLTVTPAGGQIGTTVEVTLGGTHLDDASELRFSTSSLNAKAKMGANGQPVANQWVVTIPANVPRGIHDVRVLTRFGISTPRAFVVGGVTEVLRVKPNTSAETALELETGTICNAHVTAAAVDYYAFKAKKGQRLLVECAAAEIDSKLIKVLILADAQGRDLLVNRRGGDLDWTAPADGKFYIKVHSLTFEGGPEHFYRLSVTEGPRAEFVFPPALVAGVAPKAAEVEPNGKAAEAQKVTLPCDLVGRFYPAADVDIFEFTAKKGEEWWIEVTSQRLGLRTDPFVVVQSVSKDAGGVEKLTDVVEINDIPNPVPGTPYDAGSSDSLGKLTIKEDGVYRLQVRDLFGGTRGEPRNVYRLQVRKAEPDFTLLAWPFYAPNVANDRSAPAKPVALWKGGTLALQVAVVRRDGLDGEIELRAEGLPPGVTASGSKVPAGKSQGFIFLTAAEKAPGGLNEVKLLGRAMVNGKPLDREMNWASVVWHVSDMNEQIPRTRPALQKLVSVSAVETHPLSIAPAEAKVFEAAAGQPLKVPLTFAWRGEPSSAVKLKALGTGFEAAKEFDVPLKAAKAEAVLDLAALKTPPGEYTIAFYGVGKGKYRMDGDKLAGLEAAQKQAEEKAKLAAYVARTLTEAAKKAAPAEKGTAELAAKEAVATQKAADTAKAESTKRAAETKQRAQPKDFAEIVVSEPVRIRVIAAAKK